MAAETMISRDGRRSVTTGTTPDDAMSAASKKRKHIVLAATASGAERVWRTTSVAQAETIRAAYVARGGVAARL